MWALYTFLQSVLRTLVPVGSYSAVFQMRTLNLTAGGRGVPCHAETVDMQGLGYTYSHCSIAFVDPQVDFHFSCDMFGDAFEGHILFCFLLCLCPSGPSFLLCASESIIQALFTCV